MADLVNFNRAKKAKAKAEQTAQATANRVAFGRSKSEKAASSLDAARKSRELDGKKRD